MQIIAGRPVTGRVMTLTEFHRRFSGSKLDFELGLLIGAIVLAVIFGLAT